MDEYEKAVYRRFAGLPEEKEGELLHLFSDYDRELTMAILRLEDGLFDYKGQQLYLTMILEDMDSLADALFALWSQSKEKNPHWKGSIIRVYRLALDILNQLTDEIWQGEELSVYFALIYSYANLFVSGLIRPNLQSVLSITEGEGERLRAVSERIDLLLWTLACAKEE